MKLKINIENKNHIWKTEKKYLSVKNLIKDMRVAYRYLKLKDLNSEKNKKNKKF